MVCLYVDIMIYANSNANMVKEFKNVWYGKLQTSSSSYCNQW
jgi:hypothetical protein